MQVMILIEYADILESRKKENDLTDLIISHAYYCKKIISWE